jgi:hypothetical protein
LSIDRNETDGPPRGPKILQLEPQELVAVLDYDRTRKLSGEYILLTDRTHSSHLLNHPLFDRVSRTADG